MTVAYVAILTQTLALLSPLLILGRIRKWFDRAVWIFYSCSAEQKIIYTSWPIKQLLFICHLVAPELILGHYKKTGLINPTLIFGFLSFFDSKVTENLTETCFKNLRCIEPCKQIHRHTDVWSANTQNDWQIGKLRSTKT